MMSSFTKCLQIFVENLWNGFAGMLYDNPRPEANIAMYTEEQWMDLADQASRYDNRSPDQRVFTFEDSTTSDPYYEWVINLFSICAKKKMMKKIGEVIYSLKPAKYNIELFSLLHPNWNWVILICEWIYNPWSFRVLVLSTFGKENFSTEHLAYQWWKSNLDCRQIWI